LKKIVLLSDTHSWIDKEAIKHFEEADEIWHAGDIGSLEVTDYLAQFAPIRAVYGNIDNTQIRTEFPEELFFEVEGYKIWMIHIGGYPPKYSKRIIPKLEELKPSIFICGHSHILKVLFDKNRKILHLNPGAFGKHGFHKERTLLKFELHQGNITNLQVVSKSK
jgi:putative phosphoesterase